MTEYVVTFQVFACFYSAYKIIVSKDSTYSIPDGLISSVWAGAMLFLGFDSLPSWPQTLTSAEIASSIFAGSSLGLILWLGANVPEIRRRLVG